MLDRVLQRCRRRIRTLDYVVTLHAEEEMAEDGYGILDLEAGVLTGTILERQRDERSRESKYRIRGTTQKDRDVELIVKFGRTGVLVVITVYQP